ANFGGPAVECGPIKQMIACLNESCERIRSSSPADESVQHLVTTAVRVQPEGGPVTEVDAAGLIIVGGGPVKHTVVRLDNSRRRLSSISRYSGEAFEQGVTASIFVHAEQCALAVSSAVLCRSVEPAICPFNDRSMRVYSIATSI